MENEAAEYAYRRGFDQGVAAAVEAVEAGYSMSLLERWKKRIYKWRLKYKPGCRRERPEWLAREAVRPTVLGR